MLIDEFEDEITNLKAQVSRPEQKKEVLTRELSLAQSDFWKISLSHDKAQVEYSKLKRLNEELSKTKFFTHVTARRTFTDVSQMNGGSFPTLNQSTKLFEFFGSLLAQETLISPLFS